MTDPAYSTTIFIERLLAVPGWDTMPVAAQTVQRSAFPAAYAKWEGLAADLVQTLADVADPSGCGRTAVLAEGGAGAAIAFALAELGKPYLWGGTGPNRYDCSGLMLRAFQSAGINMLRVSREQFYAGGHVPVAQAQAGDLLFYATDPSDPRTIHHVSLYLSPWTPVRAPPRTGRDLSATMGVMPTEPVVPASTTPVADYLDRPAPGATEDHLVVPRSLAQSMPLRWQQVFVGLLADLHDAFVDLPWPDYQVVPSRWERLTDLDEEQLASVGYHADLGADGELEYRDARDVPVPDPDGHRVLAPVDDPLPRVSAGRVPPRAADPL